MCSGTGFAQGYVQGSAGGSSWPHPGRQARHSRQQKCPAGNKLPNKASDVSPMEASPVLLPDCLQPGVQEPSRHLGGGHEGNGFIRAKGAQTVA